RQARLVFARKAFLGVALVRMRLQGEWRRRGQHLEQKRKLSSESCRDGRMKDFIRSRLQQLVERNDAAAEHGARRGIRMRSHPKLGAGSPVRILFTKQSGNEVRIAPGIMLHHGFQGENSWLAPPGADHFLKPGFLTAGWQRHVTHENARRSIDKTTR